MKYRVEVSWTEYAETEIEAESEEKAREIADNVNLDSFYPSHYLDESFRVDEITKIEG